MPGLVVSIAVTEGQEVKAGETLAVVEAMKMQNVLRAERDGTVKKIHATAGATLAVDAADSGISPQSDHDGFPQTPRCLAFDPVGIGLRSSGIGL